MRNLKKVLSLSLAVIMLFSMMVIGAGAVTYTDEASISDDYAEAVDVMSAIGVFDGTDGVFNPTGNLKRSEAAKIIMYIVMGKTNADVFTTTDRPFIDVTDSHWAVNEIAWCYEMGIVSGVNPEQTLYTPEAYLTGTQFAKMLLVALGYDSEIEGYQDNPMWSTNINSDALNAGLRVKLEAIDMSKYLTREQACQMAFNALTANVVDYADRGFEYNGLIVGASPAAAVVRNELNGSAVNYAGDVQGAVGLDTMQLCEKYYPHLRVIETIDGMNRPAYTWTLKNVAIGRYAVPADYTGYITASASTVYGVVDSFSRSFLDADAKVFVNGVETTTNANMRGNKVEIYMNEDLVNVVDKIVVTHTTVDVVGGLPNIYSGYMDIAGLFTGETAALVSGYSDLSVGDVVMWYKDAEGYIVIEKADSFAAVMTASTANTGDNAINDPNTFTIGGNIYRTSGQTDSITAGSLVGFKSDTTAWYWLDNAGHIIYAYGTPVAIEVLQVLKNNEFKEGNVFANSTYQSQVVFGSTGKTQIINVTNTTEVDEVDDTHKNNSIDFEPNEGLNASGKLYAYIYNESGNVYTLTELATTVLANGTKITRGIPSAYITSYSQNGVAVTDSATVYLVRDAKTINDLGVITAYKDTYTMYVGYENVPSLTVNTNGAYAYSNDYIFINDYKLDAAVANDHIYVLNNAVTAHYKANTQVDYFTANAIVNGQVTTVKIANGATVETASANDADADETLSAANNPLEAYTIYEVKQYDAATGYISIMKEATTSTGPSSGTPYWVDMTGSRAAYNNVIVLGGTSYAYTADCVVYTVATNGAVSIGNIANLGTDTNDEISVVVTGSTYGTAANNTVKEIYVRKVNPSTTPSTPVLTPGTDPTGGTLNAGTLTMSVNFVDDGSGNDSTAKRTAAASVLTSNNYVVTEWTSDTEVKASLNGTAQPVTFTITYTEYFTISVNGTVMEYVKAGENSTLKNENIYDSYNTKGGTGYVKAATNSTTLTDWSYAAYADNTTVVLGSAAAHVYIKTGYVTLGTITATTIPGDMAGAWTVDGVAYDTSCGYLQSGKQLVYTITLSADVAVAKNSGNAASIDAGNTGATFAVTTTGTGVVHTTTNGVLTFDDASGTLKNGDKIVITYPAAANANIGNFTVAYTSAT